MEVMLSFSSGKHEARVSDLSMGGCFVDTILDVNEGEKVSFELQLPSGQWLSLTGEIVYVLPRFGFGLQFIDLTEEQRVLIEKAIMTHGGNPAAQPDSPQADSA